MWVFAKDIGFISIVKHNESDDLLVRARRRDHLEQAFPGREKEIVDAAKFAEKDDDSQYDYAWRLRVPRGEVVDLLMDAVLDLDYESHVKEEVSGADNALYRSMLDCWTAMMRYQESDGEPEDTAMWGDDAAAAADVWSADRQRALNFKEDS